MGSPITSADEAEIAAQVKATIAALRGRVRLPTLAELERRSHEALTPATPEPLGGWPVVTFRGAEAQALERRITRRYQALDGHDLLDVVTSLSPRGGRVGHVGLHDSACRQCRRTVEAATRPAATPEAQGVRSMVASPWLRAR